MTQDIHFVRGAQPAPRERRATRNPLPRTLLALCLLAPALLLAAPATAPAAPVDPLLASLNAYTQGEAAWARGDRNQAIAQWEEACSLGPQAATPRLALARALLLRQPDRAIELYREALHLGMTEYSLQRWVVAHGILALLIGGSLGACLLMLGLILRHLRAVHHTIMETLEWALRSRRWSALLAAICLAFPLFLNLGPLVTLLFLLFLCSFRFSRRERVMALAVAAWVTLIGPVSLATTPLWSLRLDGRDAQLVDEIQRRPVSPLSRSAVAAWRADEPNRGIPLYLQALAQMEKGDPRGALHLLERAGSTGEVPPPVLACELGSAWSANGRNRRALDQYLQAISLDPSSFAAHYNLGLLQAAEGRFQEADLAMERAAHLDLDRLRDLGRAGQGVGPRPPIPALWSARDLWALTLRSPAGPLPPAALAALFPLRSLLWTAPLGLAAALLGFLLSGRLARLLRVHVCYQCGRPVCRRCLMRIDRRAYCRGCGETLSAIGLGESTRLLIHRLLEEQPSWTGRTGRFLFSSLPGTGAALRGHPELGALASLLAGVGLAFLFYPLWGRPILSLPQEPATLVTLRGLGTILLLAALLITTLGVQWAENRQRSLKVFLDRDVDRMAA